MLGALKWLGAISKQYQSFYAWIDSESLSGVAPGWVRFVSAAVAGELQGVRLDFKAGQSFDTGKEIGG